MEQIMDARAYKLEQAYELMNAGEYQQTVEILLEYIKQSPQDYEAQYLLARAYACLDDFKHSFEWCKKAADEGRLLAACALLALHYCEGVGVKKSGPDTLYYIRLAEQSDDPEVWNSINLCKGIMYWQGLGVDKNVPKAYSHFKKAGGLALADEYIKVIEDNYPMTADGKIDLKKHKRSRWATFLLWMIISNNSVFLIASYASYSEGVGSIGNVIINALLVIFPFFVLFWQKWAFIGMIVSFFLFPYMAFNWDTSVSDGNPMLFTSVLNSIFYLFSLLALLIRKKGYCNPWCALTGKEDTGCNPVRRLLGCILRYGDSDAYKVDAPQTKLFSVFHYIGTVLMVILASWAAWEVAQKSFGLGVEWNIFHSSGLWTFFSIIGFFLQFFNWQHTSFEHVTEVTFTDGSKKQYKSQDIIDNMEGSFLWPLVSHLVLIPAAYGAIIYYVLMICLALIGSIMPYVLALLVVGSVYFYYKWGGRMKQRKFRMALLVIMSVLFAFVYVGLADNLPFSFNSFSENNIGIQEEKRFVRCVGNGVNLREQPDSNSARLYREASDSGRMFFIQGNADSSYSPYQLFDTNIVQLLSEEGDWYKLSVDGVQVYALKKYFVSIYPANLEEALEKHSWMKNHLVQCTSGEYKNSWLFYEENEMDEMTTFYSGKKKGDYILFTEYACLNWQDNPLVKLGNGTSGYIDYEGCNMLMVDGEKVIDLKNASDDFLSKVFEKAEACQVQLFYFLETNSFLWIYNKTRDGIERLAFDN
jgi:tetratricopeptide (TPR) repeat protein